MAPIDLDEDGFVDIAIAGISNTIDLYEAHRRLRAFAGDESQPFALHVKAMLAEVGYGDVSERVADRFAIAIFDRVELLKKKDEEPSAASASTRSGRASSTGSPCPNCPDDDDSPI